ncbi:MAG: ABC transporter substrate-binding protein [Actinomycetota bacterium]
MMKFGYSRLAIVQSAAAALVLVVASVGLVVTDEKSQVIDDTEATAVPTGIAPDALPTASAAPGTKSSGTLSIPGAPGAPGGAPALVKGKVGQGVTDTEIRVGIQVPKNLNAAIQLLGASTTAADNLVQQVQAVEKWINAHGGVAGRKLRVILHETDPLAGTFATQSQEACTHFTEDAEVIMAANTLSSVGPDMIACLAQHDTPMIAQNSYPYDQAEFDKYGKYLYQTARWEAGDWHRAYLDGLKKQDFFKGGTLGLARFDSPAHKRVAENVIRPHLKKLGVTLKEEAVIRMAGRFTEFSGMSGEIANAVLKFNDAGVNRVIFVEEAGALLFFWLPAAENAGYYPRYGLNSQLTPALHALNHARSMQGAVGVGWSPQQDVFHAQDPGVMPGFKLCDQIIKEARLFDPDKPRSGAYECDSIFFFKEVLDRAIDLTPDGIRATVHKLGTSFESALTFRTRFAPSRQWGVNSLRNFAFDNGCNCFRYTGNFYAAPD